MKLWLILASASFTSLVHSSVVKLDASTPAIPDAILADPALSVSRIELSAPMSVDPTGQVVTSTTLPSSIAFPNAIPLPATSTPVPESTAASAVAILGYLLMLRRRTA